jgi:hypothetical protein
MSLVISSTVALCERTERFSVLKEVFGIQWTSSVAAVAGVCQAFWSVREVKLDVPTRFLHAQPVLPQAKQVNKTSQHRDT